MGIADGGSMGQATFASVLAILSWVVAGALAIAIGGVILGICAYRRGRQAEARLRRLETAVGEFCEALRARLALERGRSKLDCRPKLGGRPKQEGQEEAA